MYGYQDTCFPDFSTAQDAYFGSFPVSFALDASGNHVSSKFIKSPDWQQITTVKSPSGVLLNQYVAVPDAPSFYSCSMPDDAESQFQMGLEIGLLMLGLMVTAACYRVIYERSNDAN